jgi:hypothetical protein
VLADSLAANHGAILVKPRLAGLLRAARIFGFHLASLDMRQSSDVHERVLAELFKRAGVEADYAALDEDGQGQAAAGRTGQPRLLYTPYAELFRRDPVRAGVLRTAREIRKRYGARAIRNYIISHTETVSDLLEVLLLQKETGLLRPGTSERRDGDPAVRDHPRPAARREHHGRVDGAAAGEPPDPAPGPAAGSHAGLFGLEQGRRLPDLELGAVPGRAETGEVFAAPASSCACSTAAAAPSAAAAARATTPSWPSRRAP